MTHGVFDPPVSELERRLAERRRLDAQAFPLFMPNLLNSIWLALQVVAGACVIGAAVLYDSGGLLGAFAGVALIGLAIVAAAISAVPAALAAVLVVIHWPDLARKDIANGTAPWIAVVVEATVLAVIWKPWT